MSNIRVKLVFLFCFASWPVFAADESGFYSKAYEENAVKVEIDIDKTNITLADTINLQLTVSMPQDYEIELLRESLVSEDFRIVDDIQEQWQRADGKGNIIRRYNCVIEPNESGQIILSGMSVSGKSESDKVTIKTDDVSFTVVSNLTDEQTKIADQGELNSLFDQIVVVDDVLDPAFDLRFWIAIGTGFCLLVIAAVVVLILMVSRRKDEIVKVKMFLVADAARELLEKLRNHCLLENGKVDLHYTVVNNILRHYIEYRFRIRAAEMTTEEFLDSVKDSDRLDFSSKEELRYFLEHCDMVKFAKFVPDIEQMQKVTALAEAFVSKTNDGVCSVNEQQMQRLEELLEEV